MAFSYEEKTGNGSTHTYTFTFDYILKAHVKLFYTRDILANTQASTLTEGTDYNFTADKSIQLVGSTLNSGTTTGQPYNLPNGTKLMIERQTPDSSQISAWQDGSNLTAEALNNADLQNLYVVQETQDKQDLSSAKAIASETASNTATTNVSNLTATQFNRDGSASMTGNLNTGNNKITNLADPTSAQDAVTKAYLERTGSIASAQILDGTIVDGDVNASAAISGSKLQASSGSNAGSMSSAHYTKIEGIEASATADQTSSEIKSSYESNSDTNAYTDAEKTKLSGIESNSTADQSASEIKSSYESNSNTNAFTDANKTLVDAISATSTEINYITNVTSDIQSQINNKQPLDSELTTLAGMTSATASKLAAGTNLTSDIADLNQVDGLTKQTTISDSDASFPTSGAVVDYVAAQIAPLGGLEVVATEVAFPNTQPASGVVISISDAGGVVINGSGVSTTGRTVGGATITINGFPSSLYSETLVAGVGLMVSSTGSSQTYNYHKILGKEDDIKQLSDDINDFNARYRVGSSNPSSALDAGDLFFNTSTSKLLVYNGTNTAWEEAQSIGNFYISTLSPAFNGSLQDFTITNAPTNAEQILLVINGVVQKPNAGTSTPSEGFALSGSTVKLGAVPASTDTYFAVVIGSTVNIGTPSDNTVDTDILMSGAVTNAKVNASAAIAGTKISPDFGSQNIVTTGNLSMGPALTVTGADPYVSFVDSNNNSDFQIYANGGNFKVYDATNSAARITVSSSGTVDVAGNLDVGAGVDVTGNLTVVQTASTNSAHIKMGTSTNQNTHLELENDGSADIRFGCFGSSANTFGNITANNGFINTTNDLSINSASDTGTVKIGIGATPSTKLLIDSSGRVGIGKTPESAVGAVLQTKGNDGISFQRPGESLSTILRPLSSGLGLRLNYQDGSEVLRIDNSGFVWCSGTTNPTGASAKNLNLISTASKEASIAFARSNSLGGSTAGGSFSLATNGDLTYGVENVGEAFRIKADRDVQITDGNLIIGTAGHGIDFSATSHESGMSSELLNEYEVGTWTPTPNGTNPSWTTQGGTYVKIGHLVHIDMWLQASSTTTSTDAIQITLPFTASSVSGVRPTSGAARCYGLRNWQSYDSAYGFGIANTAHLYLRWTVEGGNPASMSMNLWQNGAEIHMSMSYRTEA